MIFKPSTINFKRLAVYSGILVLVLVLALLAFVFRRIEIESPSVPQNGVTRYPEISVDEANGEASMIITVLTYNIAGLPWPIGCGKFSRETDQNGKRIPIACNRSEAVKSIGDTLGALRQHGLEPDIVMMQEAFIPAVAEIPVRAGYPNWVTGPGPQDLGPQFSERASQEFVAARRFWKGEKLGKRQPSGLLIASNFPIVEQFNLPFPQWECAGFDCLANKAAVLVRIQIPGLPDLLELATAHYNALNSTGVPLERAHEAHRLQIDATAQFLEQNANYELPGIWGGDFNMRRSEDRIRHFIKRYGEGINEVTSWCLQNLQSCDFKIRSDSEQPWFENQDLQGWASGTRVEIKPVRIEEVFDEAPTGVMASDHNGFIVTYRLSWPAL